MKRYFFIFSLLIITIVTNAQEAFHLQNGASITIQNGAELALQGGLSLENGSSLINNGTISLKNNSISNISNWTDNSILGALTGTGIVIFNSDHPQQFSGPTHFYTVYINTNELTLNNDLNISNLLRLIHGKINTGNNVVFLVNTAATSLENDVTNVGYANSWINGFLKRSIATNASNYDFPVGNAVRSNLLQFMNNNITGPSSLTASFAPKPGTDVGLNIVENGNTYTGVNNGGVWKLVPSSPATNGNYALQLYFNGFTGLQDNHFGILRRPDASTNAADWIVPTGSLLEPLNGTGRKVNDGFARRYNISDFSQFGIGEFTLPTPCEITGQPAVCVGSPDNIYSGPSGMTTYLWSVTGATIVGSNTGQSVNISVGGTGSFTLNLITTLNGVAAQCSKTVNVTFAPTCDIVGPNELCAGLINGYLGPVNMLTYSWTTSAGLTIMGPNTNALVSVTSSTPGPQMLTLNATGIGGCTSQCTKIIQVIPVVPCSIAGASNVTSGTTNNQYTGPANMTSYNWSVSGNGTIVGSNSGSSVNVTAGTTGTFTLMLTTTLASCSTSCNKTVAVDPATTYSCTVTGLSEVCKGSANSYTAPANLSSYNWSVIGAGSIVGSATGSSVSIAANNTGTYSITLQTILNGISCSSQKTVTVIECVNACSYTQGFYGNRKGSACYNNSGITMNSSELMLNAFGATTSQVFGNVANKRVFTLFKSDISSGAIYKMLPGGGNAKSIDVDNVSPFDGAYYSDETTWALVPLQFKNPQKGKILNSLLAQTITLWFDLQNSSTLGSISLANDTLVTQGTTKCGSSSLIGEPDTFGLPHSIVVYLNGNNSYPATVNGLFVLANDVLGGVNTSMSPSEVTEAVDIINNAFDECRVLVGTIPYTNQVLTKTKPSGNKSSGDFESKTLKVVAYPNPYQHRFQLIISSPVTGMAKMEFFTLSGQKVYEMSKPVTAGSKSTILYAGSVRFSTLFYKVSIDKYVATGIVLKPN